MVDDQRVIMEGIRKLIQDAQLPFSSFLIVSNGYEALDQLEIFKPDVIITDIKMPVMDGLTLCSRIRARQDEYRDIPILLLTGYSDFEFARTAITHHVLFYLLKPVNQDDLIASLLLVVDALTEYKTNDLKELARLNLREQILKEVLNGKNNYLADRTENDGDQQYLLMQFLPRQGSMACYQMIKTLVNYLKPVLFAVYTREPDLYCLLNTHELPAIELETAVDIEINISQPFKLLSQLGKALKQVHLVHFKRNLVSQQLIVSYDDISNKGVAISPINFNLQHAIYDAIENKTPQFVEKLFKKIHQQLLDDPEMSIARIYSEYTFIFMEIYKRYYCLSRHNKMQEEFEFFLHCSTILMEESDVTRIGSIVSDIVQSFSIKLAAESHDSIVLLAKQVVSTHPEMTLGIVANELHVSSQYLSTMFHRETGQPFITYQIEQRMDKAKHFLETSDLSIQQIIQRIGYTNEKHFFIVFKKIVGMSPTKYRVFKNSGNMHHMEKEKKLC